jgi:hypothetical protein
MATWKYGLYGMFTVIASTKEEAVEKINERRSRFKEPLITVEALSEQKCVGCENSIGDYISFERQGTLCKECDDVYDNKSGYCSISCCVGNGCDGSC